MADKAPAEKLSLAVRKNVRDQWENKKAEFETELSTLLGTPWNIDINPSDIFQYGEPNSYATKSLGACIASYVSDAIYNIKRFVTETHGDHGKAELNSVCTAHTMTLMADTGVHYCGCKVEAGQLRLLFAPTALGTNISEAAKGLEKALSDAPQPSEAPSLSFAARHSIKTDFDSKIGDLLARVRTTLQNPKLEFQRDFNEVGKMIKGAKDIRDDWERNLGNFTYLYFESFADRLAYEKFGEDDMLREGFAEGVPSNIVRFRVVAKMDGYNAILLENGAVVLQTTPQNFGTNIDQIAVKLLDIL